MRYLPWALTLLMASAFGADVSGKWTGTFTMDRGTESKAATAFMNLKQDGAKLTGTAGPDETRAAEVKSGTVEGNKVRFEIVQPNGTAIAFDLTLDGDHMTGSAGGEENGETRRAKVDVTRSK